MNPLRRPSAWTAKPSLARRCLLVVRGPRWPRTRKLSLARWQTVSITLPTQRCPAYEGFWAEDRPPTVAGRRSELGVDQRGPRGEGLELGEGQLARELLHPAIGRGDEVLGGHVGRGGADPAGHHLCGLRL